MAMCLLWPAAGGRLASVGSLPIGRLLPLFVRVASLDTVRSLLLLLVRKVPRGWGKGRRPVFWRYLVADEILVADEKSGRG